MTEYKTAVQTVVIQLAESLRQERQCGSLLYGNRCRAIGAVVYVYGIKPPGSESFRAVLRALKLLLTVAAYLWAAERI